MSTTTKDASERLTNYADSNARQVRRGLRQQDWEMAQEIALRLRNKLIQEVRDGVRRIRSI